MRNNTMAVGAVEVVHDLLSEALGAAVYVIVLGSILGVIFTVPGEPVVFVLLLTLYFGAYGAGRIDGRKDGGEDD